MAQRKKSAKKKSKKKARKSTGSPPPPAQRFKVKEALLSREILKLKDNIRELEREVCLTNERENERKKDRGEIYGKYDKSTVSWAKQAIEALKMDPPKIPRAITLLESIVRVRRVDFPVTPGFT